MRSIVLEGRFEAVINRNAAEAVYLFHDTECGKVKLTVPKKLLAMYRSMDKTKAFRLVAKVEGASFRRSLADPVWHTNKLVVVKILKKE